MKKTYTVWMGYDPREKLAFDVARHSILSRTDRSEVHVIPLSLETMSVRQILTRPIERRDGKLWCPISQAPMATEFAISRFCVPFLQKSGWALFVDCDIVCATDVRHIFSKADDRYAVMCVKHENPEACYGKTKMDGQVQTFYRRKNWSSVVLWNCDHPGNRLMSLEALNTMPGRWLHAFEWLNDSEIGELPASFNHLVNINPPGVVHVWHFTEGGPWLPNWKGGGSDVIWNEEKAAMKSACKSAKSAKSPEYAKCDA